MDANEYIEKIQKDKKIVCTRPWTSMEERSIYGDYRICCFINRDIGIIKKDSDKDILDLWESMNCRDIRNIFSQGRMYSICPNDCSLLLYKKEINPEYTDFYKYNENEYGNFGNEFKENREKVFDSIINNETNPRTYPLRLKLHPTNTCNYRCRMCMLDKSLKVDIGQNYYRNLFKSMPYLEELTIFGGEPFSCNITKSIIFGDEIQKYPQIHFSTISNASLLNDEIQNKLERLRLGKFSFSIDSCVEKSYVETRKNGNFAVTMRNIEKFVRRRDEGNIRINEIEINCVIQQTNYKEISKFVEYAHSLNIKSGFGFITGFSEMHNKINEIKTSLNEAIITAEKLGENETSKHLSYLLRQLPEYSKKTKRLYIINDMIKIPRKEKLLYFIRRHGKIRNIVKKLLNIK